MDKETEEQFVELVEKLKETVGQQRKAIDTQQVKIDELVEALESCIKDLCGECGSPCDDKWKANCALRQKYSQALAEAKDKS